MVILFDADDTAENLLDCWLAALNERYGTSVCIEDVTQWDISVAFPTLTKEQIYGVLHLDGLWRRLQPLPDSQSVLQQLYSEGHELYMVTATDYRTCRAKFDRILALFPFLDTGHIIVAQNKQMIRGDILIDDAPHNLQGGDYFKILFDRYHNHAFDAESIGAVRAAGWNDVYKIVNKFKEGFYDCNETRWPRSQLREE